mmetsp:Transcript_54670/g.157193  ORF Transcript_54670/g.157193 Transcript_54670/m.157193 type:complete len:235 (-) Transcript_54670:903-1607(-)
MGRARRRRRITTRRLRQRHTEGRVCSEESRPTVLLSIPLSNPFQRLLGRRRLSAHVGLHRRWTGRRYAPHRLLRRGRCRRRRSQRNDRRRRRRPRGRRRRGRLGLRAGRRRHGGQPVGRLSAPGEAPLRRHPSDCLLGRGARATLRVGPASLRVVILGGGGLARGRSTGAEEEGGHFLAELGFAGLGHQRPEDGSNRRGALDALDAVGASLRGRRRLHLDIDIGVTPHVQHHLA